MLLFAHQSGDVELPMVCENFSENKLKAWEII